MVYLQCYLLSIASILGVGILGLPVTVGLSGFNPFFVTFAVNIITQVLVLLFFVDLMQHAQMYLCSDQEKNLESFPLNVRSDADDDDENGDKIISGPSGVYRSRHESDEIVNLHSMCMLFLPKCLWLPYDISMLIIFVILLILYTLAGSEAFAQLLKIENYVTVIPLFMWALTLCIILLKDFVSLIISGLTFFKCCIILITIITTVILGSQVHMPISNDFQYIGEPFLMSNVALCGVSYVLPVLYNKVEPVKQQVRGFFLSALGGLLTCSLFIIVWVFGVLEIVPQTGCSGKYIADGNKTDSISAHCYSLERSRKLGEIASVPLTEIITDQFPDYRWISKSIQAFILISITVSFLAFGLAMTHLIGGILDSILERYLEGTSDKEQSPTILQKAMSSRIFRQSVFLPVFIIIFLISLSCPHGFVVIIEFGISILFNIQAGVFLVIMIHQCRTEKYRNPSIPWKLPEVLYHMKYILAVYFISSVIFAIYKMYL